MSSTNEAPVGTAGDGPVEKLLEGTGTFLDDRLRAAKGTRTLLKKVFPDHWTFLLGEIALYSFIILLLTGTFLTLFFQPSMSTVVYHGSYHNLDGVKMTGLVDVGLVGAKVARAERRLRGLVLHVGLRYVASHALVGRMGHEHQAGPRFARPTEGDGCRIDRPGVLCVPERICHAVAEPVTVHVAGTARAAGYERVDISAGRMGLLRHAVRRSG